MPDELTDRQAEVLGFVQDYCSENGSFPSLRLIADEFQYASHNGATVHLKALERKGYIERIGGVGDARPWKVKRTCPHCGAEI